MARKNKKKHGEEEGGEAWLLPYSDLMTLLLAVFIVLFAVSKVDIEKAEKIAQEFQESMMTGNKSIFSGEGDSIIDHHNEDTTAPQGEEVVSQEELEKFLGKDEMEYLEKLKAKMEDIFIKEKLSASVGIDMRGLVISLNNAVLFETGSAEIISEHETVLYKMADITRSLQNYVRVEGHSDNIPINTDIYPSNWELSAARAARVVRLFTEECGVSPEKLVAVGYGEYRPVADNITEEGRAKNRRIDIIILSEKYNNLEE